MIESLPVRERNKKAEGDLSGPFANHRQSMANLAAHGYAVWQAELFLRVPSRAGTIFFKEGRALLPVTTRHSIDFFAASGLDAAIPRWTRPTTCPVKRGGLR